MSLLANVHSWINEQLNASALASEGDTSFSANDVGGSPTANKLVPALLHSIEGDLVSIRERMQRAVREMQTLFPDTLKEMKNVVENAHKLQLQIDSVVRHVSTVDERTESAVSALAKVDAVKLRMEECANTLSEVHNWKSRINSLDALFESRDCTTVASELSDMQQSLSFLRNLPEFENRESELASLCSRLQTMLTPQLMDAMQRRDAELVTSMIRDFQKIGQLKSVEHLYQISTSEWIEKELSNFFHADTHQPTRIVNLPYWISDCLKECLFKLRDEHDWISKHVSVLNGDDLVAHAVKKISRRLDAWLQQFVQQQQELGLLGILDVFEVSVKSLGDLPTLPSASIIKMMMRPFISYHRRYAELEKKLLDFQLDDRVSLEPQASGVDETLRSIDEALEVVSTVSEEALSRCCRFAFGSAAKQLMTALDSLHSEFIQRLFAFLRKVRGLAGLEGSGSHTDSWAELASAFRFLRFCRRLREELQNFDHHCTSRLGFTLAPFSLNIPSVTQGGENCMVKSADVAQCLLHEFLPAEPSELDFLSSLRQNSDSESRLFLSRSADSCQKLVRAARSFVFDLMFVVIKCSLNGFENFPQWVEGADDAVAKNLPSFSLQPSDYITVIGDHMFALVQSLELHINAHLVDAADNDHDGEIMVWLHKVVTATVDLLLEHIQNVKYLSDKGAKQLHGDIDYLLNILSALGIEANALLVMTKQALILTKPALEQFPFDSDDARAVANKIASIRGFDVHFT